MKCFNPIKALRTPDNDIIFSSDESLGISELMIPCGQCIGCRLQKAETWAIRMIHESQFHDENCFITLTYSDEYLPFDGSLDYSHPTKFLKRLRSFLKSNGYEQEISYYYAGEYGDQLGRPHYHMILFGFDFSSPLTYKGTINEKVLQFETDKGHKYYTSTLLTDLWSLGHANLSNVTYDTCMYTSKYVTKKMTGAYQMSHYQKVHSLTGEFVEVLPEQARMSRKYPIGKKWIESFWKDAYPSDFIIYENKKLKVPKYYDKWLEEKFPTLYDQIKIHREENASIIDNARLNREYECMLRKHENYRSSLGEETNINPFDSSIMNYKKDQINDFHINNKE